ncbi:MAG: hypothetical protein KJP00_04480 [Bacteroidia bacterium]|nr:hypothetical protein [Bacteroidia bacterium]
MHDEFADFNDIFEPGDEHFFEFEHFEDGGGANRQELVSLQKSIETFVEKPININAIKEEEILVA